MSIKCPLCGGEFKSKHALWGHTAIHKCDVKERYAKISRKLKERRPHNKYDSVSRYMRQHNPMKNPNIVAKVVRSPGWKEGCRKAVEAIRRKWRKDENYRAKMIERMRKHNPMFNPEIAKSVWLKRRRLHTEEEKRKISESVKEWVKKHPEHIEKLREINRKRKHTSETNAKISKSKLSDKNPAKRPDVRKIISATLREKYRSGKIKPPKLSPEVKLMSSIRMRRNNPMKNLETVRRVFETRRRKGIKGSFHYLKENDPEKFKELCNNSSERMRKNNPMKDPKVVAKSFSNSSRQPNRLEKALEELVYPYGFVYSGDGSFFIPVNTTEKKIVIPDFVNKEEKKVIEVYGSYWHNPDEVEERTELYAKLGWDCLVVWDYELKNRNFLMEKIIRFTNKGKIPKTLIGKRFDELSEADKLAILGKADVCWFCNKVFIEREATYDPETDTLKCPYCQKSFKDLPPFTQHVLDTEMISLGLWHPYENPPKRKKRSSNVIRGVTREDFLVFCEHYYKHWLEDYRAGRISFEELKARVEKDAGLAWVF